MRRRLTLDVRRRGYNPGTMALILRHARRRAPAPIRFERPRLGLTVDELEALIDAALEREDTAGDPGRRAVLTRGRHALEHELARMLAA